MTLLLKKGLLVRVKKGLYVLGPDFGLSSSSFVLANLIFGTGQTCSSSVWDDQRRTLLLSNGNFIWDLAGNMWEWVDHYNRDNKPTPATNAWYEFSAISGSTGKKAPRRAFAESSDFPIPNGT